MPRSLILALAFVASAYGAIWPAKVGDFELKSSSTPASPANPAQLAEYGFDSAEQADYGAFRVTAWRFNDPTGAYAASLEQPGVRVGNYLVECAGKCPKNLPQLLDASLPHVSHASIPTLSHYLPAKGLLPHSE